MKYKWIFLLMALLLIGCGVYLFAFPISSYLLLGYIVAVLYLIAGIFSLTYAIANGKLQPGFILMIAFGLLDIIMGVFAIKIPLLPLVMMPYLLGFWLLYKSIFTLSLVLDFRRLGLTDWPLMLAFGVISLVLSFKILWEPSVGIGMLEVLMASVLVIVGLMNLTLFLKLGKISSK